MGELAEIEATTYDGAVEVRVSGEIDLSNAREVLDVVGGAWPGDPTLVVLDLSATSYLDSAGIAMIFRLAERLGHRRQELRLVVPADAPIRTVLQLTGVPQVVPVFDVAPPYDGRQ